MKFYTQYDRPSLEECPHEVHLDEGLVERAGYRETEELVMSLIEAGENLQAFREAEYYDEVPEDAPANRMRNRLDALQEAKVLDASMAKKRREAEDGVRLGTPDGNRADSDGLGSAGNKRPVNSGNERDERKPDAGELAKG